jgi:hypothetical protein
MMILKNVRILRNVDYFPRIRRKEMLQLLPNILRSMAHAYNLVINVLFDEKDSQDFLDFGN